MKTVIRHNRMNEMTVQYMRIINQPSFRYSLLKSIIESKDLDITILLDTNQHIAKKPIEQVETFLQQMGFKYQLMRAETNPTTIFGMTLPGKKRRLNDHKIAMELPDGAFSKELFDTIKIYDIFIGFGKNKTFEVICEDYRVDDKSVLFNSEYFKDSVYDSVVCECLRSSFDVEELVRKSENEIAV